MGCSYSAERSSGLCSNKDDVMSRMSDATSEFFLPTTAEYRSAIEIVLEFWAKLMKRSNINDIAMSLYHNLFVEHPEYKSLLAGNATDQSKSLLQMVQTSFRILEKHTDREKLEWRLRQIGEFHFRIYRVDPKSFPHFLDAFTKALREHAHDIFTPHVSYNLCKCVRWMINEMTYSCRAQTTSVSPEIDGYVDETIHEKNTLLGDFDEFVTNETCLEYLHLFTTKNISDENTAFIREVRLFRNNPTYKTAKRIYRKFLHQDGDQTLNLSSSMTDPIKRSIDSHRQTSELFDCVYDTVLMLLRTNEWNRFRESVYFKSLSETFSNQMLKPVGRTCRRISVVSEW